MHRLFVYWRDYLDIYKTIQKEAFGEFVERHSRFISYAKPVETEDDAISFINKIKTKHWDAKHNVYAYSLLKGSIMRYSDDGEPHGTAGVPVLDILKKNEVTNIVIVVTRYFGGILLGTGGLVRAYSSAAKLALDSAVVINMVSCFRAQLFCDYSLYGKISSILAELGAKIEESEFLGNVKIIFYIEKKKLNILNDKLNEVSSGEIITKILEEKYTKINLV